MPVHVPYKTSFILKSLSTNSTPESELATLAPLMFLEALLATIGATTTAAGQPAWNIVPISTCVSRILTWEGFEIWDLEQVHAGSKIISPFIHDWNIQRAPNSDPVFKTYKVHSVLENVLIFFYYHVIFYFLHMSSPLLQVLSRGIV